MLRKKIECLLAVILIALTALSANAQMKYEVWGGSESFLQYEDWYTRYYSIEQHGFDYLGGSEDGKTKNFSGNYPYYVVVSNYGLLVDGVTSSTCQDTGSCNASFHCFGNVDQPENVYSIDGLNMTMEIANTSGTNSSFFVVKNTDNWSDITVVTPEIQVDLDGEYWYCEFGRYESDTEYSATKGEVIISGPSFQVTDFVDSSESVALTIESAVTLADGWLNLKYESEDYTKTSSQNNTILNTVSFGEDNDGTVRTAMIIKKAENPTMSDLIGDYSYYGHWAWQDYYGNESEASIGSIKVKAGKLNASFKYTEIGSGTESETQKNLPWNVNSSTSIMNVETGDDSLDLYICQGGLLLDISTNSSVDNSDESGYGIIVKNSSGKKVSDLTGKWLMQEFTTDESGYGSYTSKGKVTIDENGNYVSESSFYDGYSTDQYQDSGKITMSSNGNFKVKNNDNDSIDGTLNVDNDIFIYSIFGQDEEVGIGIGVKVSDNSDSPDTGSEPLTNETLPISLELGSCKYPAAVFTNTSIPVQLALKVGNSGSQVFPDNAEVEVLVYADNGQQNSEPVLLNTVNMAVGKMKPGQAKSLKIKLATPANLEAGEYTFSVVCNDTAETTETCGTMTIADGFTGFDISIASVKVPDAVIAGTAVKGVVQVEITNVGNMTTDKTLTSDVKVIAREINSGVEFVIGQVDLKAGNMKPGKAKKANIKIDVPANVAMGTYELLVVANASVVGDVLPSTAEQSTGKQLAVSEPFIDLTASIAPIKAATVILPGASAKVKVPIEINNIGNTPTSNTQEIDVELYLRPTDGGDDVFAGRFENFKISNLATGKPKKMNADLVVPSTISGGNYEIIAVVDAGGDINETNEANNEAAYAQPLSFAGGFMDIAGFNSSSSKEYLGYCKGYLYGYDFNNSNYSIYVDSSNGHVNETLQTDQQYSYEEAIQYYNWEEGTNGVYLRGFGQEIEMGTIDFNFNNLLVFDGTGKGSTSSLTGTVDLYLGYGYGNYTIDLYGTASAKGATTGVKSIEFNGEKRDAIMVTFDMSIDSSGSFEGYTLNLDVSQKIVYYIIPEIGIVKTITKTTAKAAIPGYGSESGSATETRELVSW